MTAEIQTTETKEQKTKVKYQGGASDAVYGLGLLGAWWYYFTHAASFQEGVVGFFKGVFWPGFLIYELLELLNK